MLSFYFHFFFFKTVVFFFKFFKGCLRNDVSFFIWSMYGCQAKTKIWRIFPYFLHLPLNVLCFCVHSSGPLIFKSCLLIEKFSNFERLLWLFSASKIQIQTYQSLFPDGNCFEVETLEAYSRHVDSLRQSEYRLPGKPHLFCREPCVVCTSFLLTLILKHRWQSACAALLSLKSWPSQ